MPMFNAVCDRGHRRERYLHHERDRAVTLLCKECGEPMTYTASFGMPMRYFETSRPRTIWNLGHEPVVIDSYQAHRKAMEKAGVAEAPQKRGMPGCWA